MMDSVRELLSHPAPAYLCSPCMEEGSGKLLIAPVRHEVDPPPTGELFGRVLDRYSGVPGADALREFYRAWNGALLYTGKGAMVDCGGPEEAIEFFPLELWEERTRESVESWAEAGYADAEMPYGRNDFVSVAHSRGTFTYIHWVVKGPNAGRVYWWPTTMPPAIGDGPLAGSFAEFMEIVCTDPVHFVNELLYCCTRFSDGVTDEQWIPREYVSDRNAPEVRARK